MLKDLARQKNFLIIAAIFLSAAIPRIAYVNSISHDAKFRADSVKYHKLAKNIFTKKKYTLNDSSSTSTETFITPGYPLFVAAAMLFAKTGIPFFEIVIYAQAALGALTVLLTFLIGKRFLPVSTTLIACVLVAISPQLIVGSGYLLTETLFAFLLILAIYIFDIAIRKRNAYMFLLFGLVAGYGALVRPVLLLYPVLVFLPLILIKREDFSYFLKQALLVVTGMIVLWGPWLTYKIKLDLTRPTSQSAAVDSFALGSYPDLVYKTKAFRGYPYFEDPKYKVMQKSFSSALQIALERAEQRPLTYLTWYLVGKPITYWQWRIIVGATGPFIYPEKQSIYKSSAVAIDSLLVSELVHPIWVISGFLVSLIFIYQIIRGKIKPEGYPEITILVGALIYFTVVHSVLAPLPRYSYPVLPVLYLVAIYGIWKLWLAYKGFSESVYKKIDEKRVSYLQNKSNLKNKKEF